MEEKTNAPAQNHSATWQQRVRDDADWLHNEIYNDRNYVHYLERQEKGHKQEVSNATEGGIIGVLMGTGLAALESMVKKEPVRFMQLIPYAGSAGIALAVVGIWFTNWERETSHSEAYKLKHLNSIRNLLAEAYGEDALKGEVYKTYQNIKNDPILTGNDNFSSNRSR